MFRQQTRGHHTEWTPYSTAKDAVNPSHGAHNEAKVSDSGPAITTQREAYNNRTHLLTKQGNRIQDTGNRTQDLGNKTSRENPTEIETRTETAEAEATKDKRNSSREDETHHSAETAIGLQTLTTEEIVPTMATGQIKIEETKETHSGLRKIKEMMGEKEGEKHTNHTEIGRIGPETVTKGQEAEE